MLRSVAHVLLWVSTLFTFATLVVHSGYFDDVFHASTQLVILSWEESLKKTSHLFRADKVVEAILTALGDVRPNEIGIISIIILFASIAEAAFGFGGGLIAILLLSFVIGLQTSVTLFLIFQTLKGILLLRGARLVAWNKLWLVTLTLPLGALFGFLSLNRFDARWIAIALGVYLLGYVANRWVTFGHRRWPPRHMLPSQVVVGMLGGYVQGLIGSGGPLLAAYLGSHNLQRDVFRFSLIWVLFVANAFRMSLAVTYGVLNSEICALATCCSPAYGVALIIGYRLTRILTETQFSVIMSVLLALSAISLLIRNCL